MLVLLCALLSAPAEPTPPRTDWYGWQTLVPDVTGIALMGTGLSYGGDRSLFLAGAGIYLLGAPVIHFVHARPGEGSADLILRAGLPVAGFLVGAVGGLDGALLGFLGGAVAASLIDTIWLARKPVPEPVRITPSVAFFQGRDGQQHAALALAGRF
jgi:hypothetical protein